MTTKNYTFIFLFLLLLSELTYAQMPQKMLIKCPAIIEGNDTIPYFWLPEHVVSATMPFKTRKKYAEWTRLRYNVKKVYPYAILAAAKLKEYEKILEKMPNDEMRKAYMKVAEKELQKQFGPELKEFTFSQGRILIKLIDRETGHTSYELVKQLRGNFSAFMWQSFASLFGSSLKSQYDPNGEDKAIELAIRQIEAGEF